MTTMTTTRTGQVAASAAEVYDNFFVPALFADWARPVARAAGVAPAADALDVACGTGVLARAMLEAVGPQGSVTGLDVNDGMLAVAAAREPRIAWRNGRAEAMPFEDSSFDAVASQFGLMFFEDRAAALADMWRVLRPGGTLAVAVWGPIGNTPGYAALADLLARLFGEEIAEGVRAPYCLGDGEDFAALFVAAGVPGVKVRTETGTARFASIRDWVHTDVRGWTLADAIDDAQYGRLEAAAVEELADFCDDEGRVAFAAPAHIAVARKA